MLGGAKSDLMKDSLRAILGFTKETQKIETDCSTPDKNLNLNKFKFRCLFAGYVCYILAIIFNQQNESASLNLPVRIKIITLNIITISLSHSIFTAKWKRQESLVNG